MMNELQRQTAAAEETKKKYPVGTRIYIDYIADGCYPKAVGKHATVKSVDDSAQIKCVTDEGYVATVCSEYGDKFFKVSEVKYE